jgi:hypothetical protein
VNDAEPYTPQREHDQLEHIPINIADKPSKTAC